MEELWNDAILESFLAEEAEALDRPPSRANRPSARAGEGRGAANV